MTKLKESKTGLWHAGNSDDVTSVDQQMETPCGVNHQSNATSGWQSAQFVSECVCRAAFLYRDVVPTVSIKEQKSKQADKEFVWFFL